MTIAASAQKTAELIEWKKMLARAALEVFSMMVGADVTLAEPGKLPVLANVTGMVGIAGAFTAILSLRCSHRSAARMASQMLGIEVAAGEPQSRDAIGEICNIVAGDFKTKIGFDDKCMLSVPTVISGSDYKLHSLVSGERLELPIIYEAEPVWIALEIKA